MAPEAAPRSAASGLHVVLVAPEIPWNTGNVGRTCLAAGAQLHLVRPLGFSLDDRYLKRAGLDYWPHVEPRIWPSWPSFEEELPRWVSPSCSRPKAGVICGASVFPRARC